MRSLKTLVLASVAGLASLSPSGAQITSAGGSIVITPYVGVYAPSTDVGKLAAASMGSSSVLSMKHRPAAAFGTTVSYWFAERMAIEGGVVYANSNLRESTAGVISGFPMVETIEEHANLWLVNTKLMMQLLSPESPFNLRLGVGPALITRSGTAYTASDGKNLGLTDVGAAVSLCTRYNFTPALGLRLRAEDFIYQAKLGYRSSANPSESIYLGARTQHDFVLSAGLQLHLNK